MNARYEQLLRLRAIRHFSDDPPSPDELRAVLEAARWTGSAKNLQNWAFVVVTEEQKAALAECGNFTDPLRNAPVGIAIVQEPDGYEFDSGRVAQNIMLAADAIGLATCPVTLHREDEAIPVLGLTPPQRCRYAVALGRPAASSAPARGGGRKPFDEVVHQERYGG